MSSSVDDYFKNVAKYEQIGKKEKDTNFFGLMFEIFDTQYKDTKNVHTSYAEAEYVCKTKSVSSDSSS